MFISHHSLLGPSGFLEETLRDYFAGRSPLGRLGERTVGMIPERFELPDPLVPALYTGRLKQGISLVLANLSEKLHNRQFDAVLVGQGRARMTLQQWPVSEFLDWLADSLKNFGIKVSREQCICMESSCTTGIALARSAARRIASGRDQNILLLSFDPVSPAPLFAMDALSVLTRRPSPSAYSEDRDGFALSESICAAVFSAQPGSSGAAVKFRASALATEGGLTGMDNEGRGLAQCIWQVLRECEMKAPSFIKAHGTGTRLNDEVEGEVLNRIFSETESLPLVSWKPQFGHCLNGSGMFEMLLAVNVLRADRLMPVLNLTQPMKFKNIRVLAEPRENSNLTSCLGLAIGFGGVNAAYCLEKLS